MRKSCTVSLRAYQRAGRRGEPRERLTEIFRSAGQLLCRIIKKAQDAAWRDLVNSVEMDPWGRAYKIVTRKIGGSLPGRESAGRELAIADGLFPSITPPDWTSLPLWADADFDPPPSPMRNWRQRQLDYRPARLQVQMEW